MHLTTAFFANHAEIVDDMLSVEGAFWKSTTVDHRATNFRCNTVVLCDVEPDDVGQRFSMHIDGEGPTGHRWAPAHSSIFTVEGPMMFMCLPMMVLPIEPGGGRHLYSFRIDGQHERIDVPLAVRVART